MESRLATDRALLLLPFFSRSCHHRHCLPYFKAYLPDRFFEGERSVPAFEGFTDQATRRLMSRRYEDLAGAASRAYACAVSDCGGVSGFHHRFSAAGWRRLLSYRSTSRFLCPVSQSVWLSIRQRRSRT